MSSIYGVWASNRSSLTSLEIKRVDLSIIERIKALAISLLSALGFMFQDYRLASLEAFKQAWHGYRFERAEKQERPIADPLAPGIRLSLQLPAKEISSFQEELLQTEDVFSRESSDSCSPTKSTSSGSSSSSRHSLVVEIIGDVSNIRVEPLTEKKRKKFFLFPWGKRFANIV